MREQSNSDSQYVQNTATRSQTLAIRTHYSINTIQQAQKILPISLREKMNAQQYQLILPHKKSGLAVTLKRKQIQKPLHLLKIRKRINKKTKELSYVVEECTQIKTAYEHEDLCDFIDGENTASFNFDNKYAVSKDQLLNIVKKELQQRIQQRKNDEPITHNQELFQLIKPTNYLKSYNLAPPRCDFFVNKVKRQDERQLASCSIGFEDPLPEPVGQAPANLKSTELFEVVSEFIKKRPCWLKNVLLVTLKQQNWWGKFTSNELKNILRYLCYTFRNGPWKHTFCAFSFDPRTNYKAVIYQNVSLKLKKKEAEDYEMQIEEETYDPTFTDISAKYIRAYQLGDLAIQGVQELVRGKLISGKRQCSKQHGWLTQNEHSHILKLMKVRKEQLDQGKEYL